MYRVYYLLLNYLSTGARASGEAKGVPMGVGLTSGESTGVGVV